MRAILKSSIGLMFLVAGACGGASDGPDAGPPPPAKWNPALGGYCVGVGGKCTDNGCQMAGGKCVSQGKAPSVSWECSKGEQRCTAVGQRCKDVSCEAAGGVCREGTDKDGNVTWLCLVYPPADMAGESGDLAVPSMDAVADAPHGACAPTGHACRDCIGGTPTCCAALETCTADQKCSGAETALETCLNGAADGNARTACWEQFSGSKLPVATTLANCANMNCAQRCF